MNSTRENTGETRDKSRYVYNDDPRYAGLPGTPKPIMCKFCGEQRRTKGIALPGMRVIWCVTEPCSCQEGKALYEREALERAQEEEAGRKAEEDRKMRDKVRKIIGDSGIGERFLQRTFETFVANDDTRRKIIAIAKKYAADFDNMVPKRGEPLPEKNGFLITGPKGTGKTHIAAAIANDLLNRGTAVICMTERNLFDRIRQTYARDESASESAVRRVYETVPLLVIDDIGKEKATDWTLATLYAIIDGRYERAMPIIVTSNYGKEALISRLTPSGGDKTTADAIVDRLAEMCKSIPMTGESWRSK